ncbi:SO_0444 family Cu/Zn efflux transporter [Paraferrimonas sp. SM1919]|uniref:SO_0444 family Cu/Zn efflux transporter n=1 Tax=Paraferrimonas sp. SM1919 TaxID=2662263 RepID=UPI0013D3D0AE|nr:SO_0444 family Cu/Zn efflux transporter [Paraferrimonas sp. SM1919]
MLINNFIDLFVESAPWLMLGLIIAGMLKMFIPMKWMESQLGGTGVKPVLKAAIIGAPLPLCSCGVIPAAVGLRRAGASKGATTSFLVATPETGVDSVSLSYALLGPFMTIIRPIAAIISAITAGLLVGRDDKPVTTSAEVKSCCASKKPKPLSFYQKLSAGISYAATDLVKDTWLWLVIGLFFAAIVKTYVDQDYLSQWGDGIAAMALMVLISIPMYICATASTPIAAGLLLSGISPGAVLVFMLAGPATNIATLGVVHKELGKRAIGAYLFGVIGCAIGFGLLTNYLVAQFAIPIQGNLGAHHSETSQLIANFSAVVLALLMLKVVLTGLYKRTQRKKSCCS